MSGLLESESDNYESQGESLSQNMEEESHDNQIVSSHSTKVVQSMLEQYSRRLTQLGLNTEDGSLYDKESLNNLKIHDDKISEDNELVPNQQVPITTSLILNSLPDTTTDALRQMQKDEESQKSKSAVKIQIKFQPIGSVPIMNPSVCTISSTQPFSMVILFLKRRLKMDQIYCYINNSFAPNPQQHIGNLWSQFKVNEELIVSYCGTVAFG